jgi:hypothetical protein
MIANRATGSRRALGQTSSRVSDRGASLPSDRLARDLRHATLAPVSGDPTARLTALTARCEADPADPANLAEREVGDALADEVGGELALRWRLAVMRALIAAPPDGDAVREAYGELVDRYRDDDASLAKIRPLGQEIRRRESDGSLPSVLVARSDRRAKTNPR